MRWSYKTIHFELKKDSLLGSAFIDDSEMEEVLNEYGQAGWELVSLLETRDGVMGVFKQLLSGVRYSNAEVVSRELETEEDIPPEEGLWVEEPDSYDIHDEPPPQVSDVEEEPPSGVPDTESEDPVPEEEEEEEDDAPGVGSIRIE